MKLSDRLRGHLGNEATSALCDEAAAALDAAEKVLEHAPSVPVQAAKTGTINGRAFHSDAVFAAISAEDALTASCAIALALLQKD